MACRENSGSVVLICLGFLMFVTSCHCMKMTRLRALDETKNPEHTQSQLKRTHQNHGRLLIGQNSQQADEPNGTNSTEDVMDFEAGYQSDMGWWQTKLLNKQDDWPKSDVAAVQHLLKMESKVECTHDSMKLLVHDTAFTPAALIFVDRGQLSPLSLAKLPSSCGYTIRSTQRDLVLVAPYDSCFVIIEENSYVLPLRWWGLPVRMLCPFIGHVSPNPPMVTCHAGGMVVRTEWTNSAAEIKANLNGNWESLLTVAHRCVFGIVEHPEGLVISVRYEPCLEKKDGLYTLELAADGETKISCPSLLAAQFEPRENIAKGPEQQSEKPSQWVYSFSTLHPTLTPPPDQTGFQFPGFHQTPEVKGQRNKVSREMGAFPRTFFPSFFNTHLDNSQAVPPEQPQILSPPKFPVTKTTDGSDHHFPSYQSPSAVMPPTWPPMSKPPPAKNEDQKLPYFLPSMFPQKPSARNPSGQEPKPLHPLYYTQASFPSHFYPLYLQQLPEKPVQLDSTGSGKFQGEYLPFYLICTQQRPASKHSASQGQLYQPFYLLCTRLKAALTQTALQPDPEALQPFFLLCTQQKSPLSSPSYSESSQDQMYQPFYLLCTQWKQSTQPPGVSQKPQHEALQSHLYQASFHFYNQLQPTAKPADITQPPQHGTPQTQVYQPLFPFYTQPKQTPKPAVTQPPPLTTPQGQLNQHFFHFYTQPKPNQKSSDNIAQPPQPVTPLSKVYQQFFPFYTQPHPTQKPAVTQPPQPSAPYSQVYQQYFQFYTKSQPTPKPPVSQPPQPGTAQSPVYQPIFHFYTQPKPSPKPAVTQTPQPATPPSKMYQQFLPFYTQPPPIPKPAVTQPLQPSAPHSQLYQQYFQFYTKSQPTSKPPVSQPLQPRTAQAHVYQPLYMKKPELQLPFSNQQQSKPLHSHKPLHPYQSYTQPKPAVVPQPSQPETLQGQAHQQMCLYSPPLTGNQLANMPSETVQGKVYGPCQQVKRPGAEMPSATKPTSHVEPVYCPQFCPSGLSSCCVQISLHQHFHISAGRNDKDAPEFHISPPFYQVVYSDPNKGLDAGQSPQKLKEVAIQQPVRAGTFPHILPRASQTAGDMHEHFQPPDGSPAALHRSSLSKTENQVPVYPFLQTDSLYPNWAYLAQHFELPNMEQRESSGINGPSKPWAGGGKLLKPAEQSELYNIQFPQQLTSELLAGNTHSRPNFMSYVSQHTSLTEQQSIPGMEQQQPLHRPEFKSSSHHNFKRAVERFFSPNHMHQDSPETRRNNSAALNNTPTQSFKTGSKNSTTYEQGLNPLSAPHRYVLLQNGPPGKKPTTFSDSSSAFRLLVNDANTNILNPAGHHSTGQNEEPLEDLSQHKGEGGGTVNPFPDVSYMQGLGDTSESSFFSISEDSEFMNSPLEQYFSAAQLKPDVLESLEKLWESLTPTDSSHLFASHDPVKTKEGESAVDQPASGLNQPLKTEEENQKEK